MTATQAQIRVALAQINPTVGDLAGNSALILRQAQLAHAAGAHLITFPEMVLTGYPVEDLALRSTFRQASKKAIAEIAPQLPPDLVAIIGYLDESADGKPQNAVALIHQGKILATYIKHHLPNLSLIHI